MHNHMVVSHPSTVTTRPGFYMALLCYSIATVAGAMLIVAVLFTINELFDLGFIPQDHYDNFSLNRWDTLGYIVIAPIIETYLLALIIKFGLKAGLTPLKVGIANTLLWAILHSLINPTSFLGSLWNFSVFSYGYLHWLSDSFKQAYLAALVPHVVLNSTIIILYFSFG